MSELREAMEQYLDLLRKLGSKRCGADGVLRSFLAFAKSEEASYITMDLGFAGRDSRPMCNRRPGLRAFGWSGASPFGEARQIRAPRFLPKASCRTAMTESGLTSSATREE